MKMISRTAIWSHRIFFTRTKVAIHRRFVWLILALRSSFGMRMGMFLIYLPIMIFYSFRMLMTPCYTKSYVAPEVFKRQEYDLSCDIWSIGCIMFTMLVGKTPFGILPTDSEEVVEQKLSSCELNFDDPKISVALSPQARSLLERLLSVDSKCRPTAKQSKSWTLKIRYINVFSSRGWMDKEL